MTAPLDTARVLRDVRNVVGKVHAHAFNDNDVAAFTVAFGNRYERVAMPQIEARPDSSDALQALVRLAAAAGWSVWSRPVAAGNGAKPGNPGRPGLLLDLSRMNRILDLDADSACVLLEPGVTYAQLLEHIDQHDLPLWVDCEANGANSVVGSIVERAVGHTPYADHLLMQCGFEIITANGEVTRTGMGALPGNDTWQLFKYNFGPYLDGLFSRSDLALVSKAGVWLMPAPPDYFPFMVTLPDAQAVAAAVESLRPLRIGQAIANTIHISHIDHEAALVERSAPAARPDFIAMLQEGRIGNWNLYGALYGLTDNIAATWEGLEVLLAALPGARVFSDRDQRDDVLWQVRRTLMRGRPAYTSSAPGAPRDLWCVAAAAPEHAAVLAMYDIVEGVMRAHDTSWQAEFAMTWRTVLLRIEVAGVTRDYALRHAAISSAIERLRAAGYALTHECADLGPTVQGAQTAAGLAQLNGQLARALDPHGVFGAREPGPETGDSTNA